YLLCHSRLFFGRWRMKGGAWREKLPSTLHAPPSTSSYRLHLPVFELVRYGPAEDRQLDANQALGLDEFLDLAFHASENAVLHLDAIAAVERRLARHDLVRILALPTEHPLDFAGRHGRRGAVEAAADEVAYARGFPEQVQDAIVELHLYHQVAG